MNKESVAKKLTGIVGQGNLLTATEDLACYAYDSTPGFSSMPDYVARPRHLEEVSEILSFANVAGIPIVPRGAGSNLSGGVVPLQGGIVLELTRANSIKEIDAENLTARVEAGVVTAAFHAAVEKIGLFYPPDPGSMSVSTMGGNIAENAGGLRGLKYGVTKDYVIGLEVVLANGDVVNTGGKTVKNVTGYDLTKLFTGSEGTLAVIWESTLKLLPKPETRKSMLAVFPRLDDAAQAIAHIIGAKVIPATLEIMDRVTTTVVEDYSKAGLPTDAEALLLIEVDGIPEVVARDADEVTRICQEQGASSVRVAQTDKERDSIWAARRTAFSALARSRPTIILEDATVPRSRIPEMIRGIRDIADKFDLMVGTFGHAGDGNLHPSILTDRRDKEEMKRVEAAVEAIFHKALELGGTLSGEHGIGIAKAPYLERELGVAGIAAMKAVKCALDPKGILNPGKLFV